MVHWSVIVDIHLLSHTDGRKPKNFLSGQGKTDEYSPCNWPYGCPTFGEYVDNAENYMLMPDNIQVSLAFVQAMVDIYDMEDGWKGTLPTVFDDHKIPTKSTMIGKFRFLISKFKNEIGDTDI